MPNIKKSLTLLALLSCLVSCSKAPAGDSSSTSNSASSSNSTPLTGNAKFLSYRDNTLGNASYQYDYDLSASIKFESTAATAAAKVASMHGTTYYNENSTGTKYLQKKVTEAGLLFDSTTYTYTSGNNLIKLNDNSSKYSISSIEDASKVDYKNYSFNKLVNNITDSFLDNGQDLADGKYKLNYKLKFQSQLFSNIAGCIDVNYFLKVINTYQSTIKFDIDSYVTYKDKYFDTYYIKFDAVVKDIVTISLTYKQTYSNVGQNFSITLPTLSNYHIEDSDIVNDINKAIHAIIGYKDAIEHSATSYDFKVKTAVDHGPSKSNPLGCAVNSTSKGEAIQKLGDDKLTIYYNNDLEVDSDYKNDDQYTSKYIKDFHIYRAKLNDGTVRDEIVRTLSNDFEDAKEASDEIDSYYFLLTSCILPSYTALTSVVEDEAKDLVTYTIGLNDEGAKYTLNLYNASIRLNCSYDTTYDPGHIDVFQIKDSFSTKEGEIVIKAKKSTNVLQSMETKIRGYYEAVESSVKSEGANTFVKFELNSTIDNINTSRDYTIPTKDSEIH